MVVPTVECEQDQHRDGPRREEATGFIDARVTPCAPVPSERERGDHVDETRDGEEGKERVPVVVGDVEVEAQPEHQRVGGDDHHDVEQRERHVAAHPARCSGCPRRPFAGNAHLTCRHGPACLRIAQSSPQESARPFVALRVSPPPRNLPRSVRFAQRVPGAPPQSLAIGTLRGRECTITSLRAVRRGIRGPGGIPSCRGSASTIGRCRRTADRGGRRGSRRGRRPPARAARTRPGGGELRSYVVGYVVVVDPHVRSESSQLLDDPARRGLPPVGRSRLVRQADHQDPAAVDGAGLLVEQVTDAGHHVVGHVLLTSLASSTKRKRWPRRPSTRQERYEGSIGRQWPPTPGPGVKRMKPNGFVEVASIAAQMSIPRSLREHRQLVDQGDVDVAERVLEQLDQLRLRGRGHRDDLVDERVVERLDRARESSSMPETTLGVLRRSQVGLPGSMRSGLYPSRKSCPARRPLVRSRTVSRALRWCRIGGRLQNDRRAGAQVGTELVGRRLDVAEVGSALVQRSGYGDHRDIEVGEVGR